MLVPILLLIAVILVILWIPIGLYNSVKRKAVAVEEQYSNIDVNLKRRADLIPNLVNTVKGYTQHEEKTLTNLVKLRTAIRQNDDPEKAGKLNAMLSKQFTNVTLLAENYPDLKASDQFLKLQDEITDTEDRIAGARKFYNLAVSDLNNACETFPSNLFAKMAHVEKAKFFEK